MMLFLFRGRVSCSSAGGAAGPRAGCGIWRRIGTSSRHGPPPAAIAPWPRLDLPKRFGGNGRDWRHGWDRPAVGEQKPSPWRRAPWTAALLERRAFWTRTALEAHPPYTGNGGCTRHSMPSSLRHGEYRSESTVLSASCFSMGRIGDLMKRRKEEGRWGLRSWTLTGISNRKCDGVAWFQFR